SYWHREPSPLQAIRPSPSTMREDHTYLVCIRPLRCMRKSLVVCPWRGRMNEVQQYLVDEELEYYRDGWISRREFLKRAAILGAGAAAAATMAASVTPTRRARAAPAAQPSPDTVAADDPSIATDWIRYRSTDGVELLAYLA